MGEANQVIRSALYPISCLFHSVLLAPEAEMSSLEYAGLSRAHCTLPYLHRYVTDSLPLSLVFSPFSLSLCISSPWNFIANSFYPRRDWNSCRISESEIRRITISSVPDLDCAIVFREYYREMFPNLVFAVWTHLVWLIATRNTEPLPILYED